jgi:hypothetical protein
VSLPILCVRCRWTPAPLQFEKDRSHIEHFAEILSDIPLCKFWKLRLK